MHTYPLIMPTIFLVVRNRCCGQAAGVELFPAALILPARGKNATPFFAEISPRLPRRGNGLKRSPMSRPRGRSQNRESQESCPEGPGAAFQRQHFGAAKARPRLIALLLALATLLVYLPVAGYGFSLFDDDDYVTQNLVVQKGLTWIGVKWALTTWHSSNWHPL